MAKQMVTKVTSSPIVDAMLYVFAELAKQGRLYVEGDTCNVPISGVKLMKNTAGMTMGIVFELVEEERG